MMNYAGVFYFVSWHDRLLQAYSNGEMHAGQEVKYVGEEECWNIYVWNDGKISLQNYRSNAWLCAEPSGKAICNRAKPDIWEKWTLYGANNKVGFLSYHNRWLCAQPPGKDTDFGGEVIADRLDYKEWESFSMIPAQGVPVHNNTWWNTVKDVFDVAKQIVPITIAP